MANLETLHQWRRFAPDIGNNRDLEPEQQLLLEVKVGLSFKELGEYQAALKPAAKEGHEAMLRLMRDYVRVVGGPHTIGGEQVATLDDYWSAISKYATGALIELTTAVPHFNSVSEIQAHFAERRSGGTASTPPRSAAKKDEKTAGQ